MERCWLIYYIYVDQYINERGHHLVFLVEAEIYRGITRGYTGQGLHRNWPKPSQLFHLCKHGCDKRVSRNLIWGHVAEMRSQSPELLTKDGSNMWIKTCKIKRKLTIMIISFFWPAGPNLTSGNRCWTSVGGRDINLPTHPPLKKFFFSAICSYSHKSFNSPEDPFHMKWVM